MWCHSLHTSGYVGTKAVVYEARPRLLYAVRGTADGWPRSIVRAGRHTVVRPGAHGFAFAPRAFDGVTADDRCDAWRYAAGSLIIPAATVRWVTSSMRMNPPVVRLRP
jgi:hypothetical protein